MPAQPRRRPPKRRKVAKVQRRPRWIGRVVFVGAALFVVFCAAAGATLWFTETKRDAREPAASDAAGGERLTQEEREALGNLLKDQNPAAKP